MNTKDWTEKMREQLDNFQVQPSDDVWAAVESELAKKSESELAKKSKHVHLRRWAIAASLLALVVGGGFMALNQLQPSHSEMLMAEATYMDDEEGINSDAEDEDGLNNDANDEDGLKGQQNHSPGQRSGNPASAVLALKGQKRSNGSQKGLLPLQGEPLSDTSTQGAALGYEQDAPSGRADSPIEPSQDGTIAQTEPTQDGAVTPSEPSREMADKYKNMSLREDTSHQLTQHKRMSVSLYAQGLNTSSQSSTPVRMSSQLLSSFATAANGSRQAPVYLSGYEERENHDMPLSAGLTGSWQLSPRWRLVSGLVYTRLSSQFETVMPGMTVVKKQRMHYVGIPFGAQYDLWSNRRLRLYGGAQAQADVNVNTKVETNGIRQSADNDRLRLSVGLSAGIQLNITPNLVLPTLGNVGSLGLYAEPSARYWIDNGCSVKNYFTEHPLGANLQVGLRFDF